MPSDTCPTLKIKTPAGPTIINASDYDKSKHTLVDADEDGVDDDKEKVVHLKVIEGSQPLNGYHFATKGNGKTVFVTNSEGVAVEVNGINPKGYKTEADAQAAVLSVPAFTPAE